MKLMTALTSVLLTSNIAIASASDTSVTNPIQVKATAIVTDSTNHLLYDDNRAVRLVFDIKGTYYIYQNSSQTNAVKKAISAEQFQDLIPLVRDASSRCPVEFTLSQPSFEITSASSPCDPWEFVQ